MDIPRPMKTRYVALVLMLLASGCGNGDDEAPPLEEGPPVGTEDARSGGEAVEPPSATAPGGAADDGAAPPGDPPSGAAATPRSGTVYSVQLGAFRREENAAALQRRLEEEGLPTWTPRAQLEGEGFVRVRVGATSTVSEARQLMERIRGSVQGEAWIAPVAPDEELPDGVMDDTGALLRNG